MKCFLIVDHSKRIGKKYSNDQIANEGVKFTQCFSSADFTPIAMGSVITSKYPNKHGIRDLYGYLIGPSIAGILKKNGYNTVSFVGNGLLSKKHSFAEYFDFWNETSEENRWLRFNILAPRMKRCFMKETTG